MIADLVSSALLGTARMPPNLAGLDAGAAAAAIEPDPAARLLAAAVLEQLHDRGSAGTSVAVAPAPAPDDDRLLLPKAAAHRIGELLATRSPLLPEWFAVARSRGFRAPATIVAALVTQAQTLPEHRADLMALAGPRGTWLAEQNPEWADLVPHRPDDTTSWTHGTSRERRRWLAEVRAVAPAAARTALENTWDNENASDRAAFVAVLEVNPMPADEPLLDTALADPRREVRDAAVRVLRHHPASGYVRHQIGRADSVFASSADASTITAAVPLTLWQNRFGSPSDAIAATAALAWRTDILDGWASAALVQRDSTWADALLADRAPIVLPVASPRAVVGHIGRLGVDSLTEQPNPFAALPHPWPPAAVEQFLQFALERAGRAAAELRRTRANSPTAAAPALRAAAAHMPIDAVAKLRVLAQHCPDQSWGRAMHHLGQDLITRTTMLEELL